MKSWPRLLCILGLLFFAGVSLTGCSPLIKTEQPARDGFYQLHAGQAVGQTFIARYSGLSGVAVFLREANSAQGEILLTLDGEMVATLPASQVTRPGFYRFSFAPRARSNQGRYQIRLDLSGAGSIGVGKAGAASYQNGAAYLDDEPQEAQLAFRLLYDPVQLGLGLLQEMLAWSCWLAAAGFGLVLPGWALGSLGLRSWPAHHWIEKLCLAAGIGLAAVPLLFLFLSLVNLRAGRVLTWLPPLAGLLVLLWINRGFYPWFRQANSGKTAARKLSHPDGLTLLTLSVILLVFLARFWVVRGLAGPMWGDSVQHAVMAQRMIDYEGLFESWQPYAPYASLTVQYGFAAFTAVLAWLAQLSSLNATLVAGQIINGLAILALYPLGLRLSNGNRWAGLGALVFAGLLSPLPAYYVNWGRYAQLTGQAILPVALWLFWEAIDPPGEGGGWSAVVLAGMSLAGMTLSYYRMPFYFVTFALAWIACWLLPRWRMQPRPWLAAAGRAALTGGLVLLLLLPWVPRLFGSNLAGAVESGVSGSSPVHQILADYAGWQQVFVYLPPLLCLAAAAAMLWSLVRRSWMVSGLAVWFILLSAIVAAQLIHLPGANMMQNFAILIALYIPAGLASGWLFGEIAQAAAARFQRLGLLAVGGFLLALAFLGTWNQRLVAKPVEFALLTHPDLQAMAWIKANIPEDALFLVEGYPVYQGASAVGADAGWYIPLLAGRANTMPPQYALLNESPIESGYSQEIVNLVNRLKTEPAESLQGIQLLCQAGVTHVYIGQGQGLVGLNASQLFSPAALESAAAYHRIYRQDRVSIYALDLQTCEKVR